MVDIFIFGAGGQASWVQEIAHIRGFNPILVDFSDEKELLSYPKRAAVHVAIGDNAVRKKVTNRVKSAWPDAEFISLIHPNAIVASTARIERGCLVLGGVVVGPDASIGEGCSLWTNSVVEHHSIIGDFSSLAPNAITGGSVNLGAGVFVGMGAIVKHNIKITSDVVVGCGATVVKDIQNPSVVMGNPATHYKDRESGDKYL